MANHWEEFSIWNSKCGRRKCWLEIRWNIKEEFERILWIWSLWDLMLLDFFLIHSTLEMEERNKWNEKFFLGSFFFFFLRIIFFLRCCNWFLLGFFFLGMGKFFFFFIGIVGSLSFSFFLFFFWIETWGSGVGKWEDLFLFLIFVDLLFFGKVFNGWIRYLKFNLYLHKK